MVCQVADVFFVKGNHGGWQEKNRMIIDVAVAKKSPTARLQREQTNNQKELQHDKKLALTRPKKPCFIDKTNLHPHHLPLL
jgi:hypothetical protein